MSDFPTRAKQLRLNKRLTQAVVSERCGITRAMISSYECGIRFPSQDILIKLARIYGVTTDYLLCVEEQRYINITGLNEREIAAVTEMVNIFLSNKSKGNDIISIREVFGL